MENRLDTVFKKSGKVLSVFITAGYPQLNSTVPLCEALQQAGADMIEIGFPFSDPLADGPVIQRSSAVALENGMSLKTLFKQIAGIRKTVSVPLLLMGYLNPVLQYGLKEFCADCAKCGIDGLIIPDFPLSQFKNGWSELAEENNLRNVFLVTQSTSEKRIREIDSISNSFIYAVSQPGVTGGRALLEGESEVFVKRLSDMKLKNPVMVGFGISDRKNFDTACKYSAGAIVGSALIKAMDEKGDYMANAGKFVSGLIRW